MAVVGRNPGLIEYVCLMPPTSDSSFPALLIVFFAPLAPVAVDWKMDCYGQRRERRERKNLHSFSIFIAVVNKQQIVNASSFVRIKMHYDLFYLCLPPPPPGWVLGVGLGELLCEKLKPRSNAYITQKKKNANHPSSHHVDC